jgi:hypothetical protein
MNPSIRVKLIFGIQEVVASLALRDINLILFQFGVPDYDFDGDWRDGFLHRLGSASDEQLMGMASHFGLSIPEAPPPAQTALNEADRLWEPDCFRLFISHTHPNKELAGQIKRDLLPRGISCFVAHDDIEPTKSWERELLLGLKSMDGLLAVLSDDFRASMWTDQEVGAAIVRSLPIVTLSMNSQLPYGFIGHIQTLRRAKIAANMGAKTLLENFMKTPARPKIIRGAISKLCAASNYASATLAVEVVGADESLEPPLLQKIFDAACSNNRKRLMIGF